MIRAILALGIITSVAAPALADEYYVVRGPDRHCRVVERIPEDRTIVRVGPLSFKTRDEAERQVDVICRDSDGVRVEEREEHRERRY